MAFAEWDSGANLFIRKHQGDAGYVLPGHTHHFDHTTIVFTGKVRVTAESPDGTIRHGVFEAPDHFLVRADTTHRIEVLADGTEFWCVYAHRDPQGRVVQRVTGWEKANQ